MSKKPSKGPKDRIVCFCYNVPESVIVEAVRKGCTSLMDIRRETYASTGCAGCAEEVKKILRKKPPLVPSVPEKEPGNSSDV